MQKLRISCSRAALAPLSHPALWSPRLGYRGSEMGLNGRWSFMALLAVAIVALAGCAASGPNMMAEPCGGFYMCTSWH